MLRWTYWNASRWGRSLVLKPWRWNTSWASFTKFCTNQSLVQITSYMWPRAFYPILCITCLLHGQWYEVEMWKAREIHFRKEIKSSSPFQPLNRTSLGPGELTCQLTCPWLYHIMPRAFWKKEESLDLFFSLSPCSLLLELPKKFCRIWLGSKKYLTFISQGQSSVQM